MQNTIQSNYSIEQFTEEVLAVEQRLREEYSRQAEYYADVSFDAIRVTVPHILAAFRKRGITSYYFSLTYNQSLHVRGNMPTGAIHVSVLFSVVLEEDDDEDDSDTVYSEYDTTGQHVKGSIGRFIELVPTI